jgi:GAF domain-containing protein
VAELKDNINTMIDNLRLTTDTNTEQDWLKTNLARFTGMLQGQRDLATVGQLLLTELVPLVNAHQGVIYRMESESAPHLTILATYADGYENSYPPVLRLGEGFIGQCARDMKRLLISDVPPDTVPVRFGVLPGPAAQSRRVSRRLRGADQGRARSRFAQGFLGDAPHLP